MAASGRTRLIVVVAVVAAVLAVAGVGAVRAGNEPSLPSIPADRLLASTVQALSEQPVVISGDAQTFVDLGLPKIPSELGGEGGVIAMVNGTQRYRVWHSADGVRVAHVSQLSERDLVVNRDEAWWWDSSAQEAVRLRLDDVRSMLGAPPGEGAWMHEGAAAAAARADPLSASRAAIDALAPYARVSVEGTAEVAGRSAYRLVLTPETDGTLVASVVVSVDAETRLPLRFEVVSRSTGAVALSAGFVSVSFDAIDPAVFTFSPPEGAEVIDAAGAAGTGDAGARADDDGAADDGSQATPLVFGSGFDARAALPLDAQLPVELDQLLPYAGPLVSAAIVSAGDGDRWLLVGSVPLEVLQGDVSRLP